VYLQLLDILKPVTFYKLSDEENEAINSALKVSEEGATYPHNEIISEAQVNSTLTHSKNLSVFTLNPEGNSQIFLLTPFRVGVKQEKNQTPMIIC
jgi:hypothetical protein